MGRIESSTPERRTPASGTLRAAPAGVHVPIEQHAIRGGGGIGGPPPAIPTWPGRGMRVIARRREARFRPQCPKRRTPATSLENASSNDAHDPAPLTVHHHPVFASGEKPERAGEPERVEDRLALFTGARPPC